MKSLPYREVGAALVKVAESGSFISSRAAYAFMVLTAARTIEVRRAVWSEIDTEAAVWRIPGSKTKNGQTSQSTAVTSSSSHPRDSEAAVQW